MLTNATLRAARPRARAYKLPDGQGLFLHVLPSGARVWRARLWLAGREMLLTLGHWPDLDLGAARDRRDRARAQVQRGEDPRLAEVADDRFAAVARRWHAQLSSSWSRRHAADVMVTLERDVFPAIGDLPVGDIDPPAVLRALRAIERRGAIETARRVRHRISGVFGFAISEGLCRDDPAATVARAIAPAPASRRQPALTDLAAAQALLAAADQLPAAPAIKLASRFLALTAVRLAAVRGMTWDEIEDIDGAAPIWRIPARRMKLSQAKKIDQAHDHIVPLSRQAADLLRAAAIPLHAAGASPAGLVFCGRRPGQPIGEGAIGDLYDRAGFAGQHVPHGWRATFSTIMNELRPECRAVIDLALGHSPKDRVEAAYNRAEHVVRRRELYQQWADLLTGT